MKCPLCKDKELRETQLEKNFSALECDGCGGYWVHAIDYWRWLKENGHRLPGHEDPKKPSAPETSTVEGEEPEVVENIEAKICPDCGHFLTRRKVGHGIKFRIERCATCGGIWFDKNEWEILKQKKLHDEVHVIFSQEWQENILEDEIRKNIEEEYLNIFGEKDFEELKRIKKWITEHPEKSSIISFLCNTDI